MWFLCVRAMTKAGFCQTLIMKKLTLLLFCFCFLCSFYMAVSTWHCFAEYCSCIRSKPWRINLLRGKYFLDLSYYMMFCIVIFVYICVQQERSSLLKKLSTLKDLDCAYPADKLAAADVDQSMQLSITGLETFCLSNKVFFLIVCFQTFLVVFVLW